MNEWIPVSEDLPQHDLKHSRLSIDVLCKLNDGQEVKGLLIEDENQWITFVRGNPHKIDVIAWKSL